MTPGLAEVLNSASGFIFDMDGTIALGDSASGGHRALPGAIALLRAIRRKGVPFRVFTNGTAKAPAVYAASLRSAGFELDDAEMMTPSSSAASWFVSKGISRVRVLGNSGVAAPLVDAGITCFGPAEPAEGVEAVYTGWHREFVFPDLEAACRSVWDGAILTTASHVPFFATATGRGIGASYAINAMITAMTGKRAKVLGKPSRIAFDAAAHAMGITGADRRRIVIFGDDPALEMRMAHNGRATGIGMTTGIMGADTVDTLRAGERPHAVVSTLEPLANLIRG